MKNDNEYAKNLKQLAVALDVSQNTLTSWTRRPDKPETKTPGKGYNIKVWKVWMDVKQLGNKKSNNSVKDRIEIAKARNWELKNLEIEGKTMPTEDVENHYNSSVHYACKILFDEFCIRLPPDLVGLDAIEIRKRAEASINKVRQELSK